VIKKYIHIVLLTTFFLLLLTTSVSALPPTSDVIYEGIDVSNWQGYINYEEVKNDGISVVYIKSSQGTNITDPYFRTNYTNAKANNLHIGFYHYVMARTEEEAIREAEYFSSVISGTAPDCKLAMDFENFGNLNVEEINRLSTIFLNRVQELTGKEMIIYSDAYNARNVFSRELAASYPLWIAEYGVETPASDVNWPSWTGFQYTNSGRLNGIRAFVDRNKFTDNIFLSAPSTINTSGNTTNQIETYTVRRGNTLSEIANEFGTTVTEIAGLNGINNVNLIFPGQVLKIDVTRGFNEITGNAFDMNHVIYTIKRGNTLTSISRMFHVSIESIANLNHIRNINLIYAGERLRINN